MALKEANVGKKRKDSWTDAEEQYVLDNLGLKDKEIAAGLPRRSEGAVAARRRKLGHRRYKGVKSGLGKHMRVRPGDMPDRSESRFAAVTRPSWEGFIGTSR